MLLIIISSIRGYSRADVVLAVLQRRGRSATSTESRAASTAGRCWRRERDVWPSQCAAEQSPAADAVTSPSSDAEIFASDTVIIYLFIY